MMNKRIGDRAVWRLRHGALCMLLGMGLLTGLALHTAGRVGQTPTHVAAGFLPAIHPLQGPLLHSLQAHTGRRDGAVRFSTYLGGRDLDVASALAVDTEGFIYVAGTTTSDDFPTRNAAQAYNGGIALGTEVFLAKLTPGGDALVYATYLGGFVEETVTALTVDKEGRVYLAGSTASPDFPSRNALQGYMGGGRLLSDAFIARLSPDGAAVDFATFFGGTGDETITALTLDAGGNLYAAGTTTSDDLPTTPGVVQPGRESDDTLSPDAFVVKLTPDDDRFDLAYVTYLGGTGDEVLFDLAVDRAGRVWITGATSSSDFPTREALQDALAGPDREGEGDVFLARLDENGAALDFATYLGGSQDDQGTGLTLDTEDNVYLTGWTQSKDFPATPGVVQPQRRGIQDAFAVKLTEAADETWQIDYATFLGGPGFEMGVLRTAVDAAGRLWLGGATSSEVWPTLEAVQTSYGGGANDAFLARLGASGRVLGFSTFLGGNQAEALGALALGGETVCLAGATGSPDFPTTNALQAAFDGPPAVGLNLSSAFVTCFETVNEASVLARVAVAPDSVGLAAGDSIRFMAEGVDQFEQPLPVHVTWTATGGVISDTGLYTAGDASGLFTVTATDPATGLIGTAVINILSSVAAETGVNLPTKFALYGNYPNPFNPETTIRFDVKTPARVVLTLYDMLGRRQATLVEKDYAPGRYDMRFDGRGWPSGIYFYEIKMSAHGSRPGTAFRDVKQMVLLR